MEGLILLVAIVLLAAPILALVAWVQVASLKHRIENLEVQLARNLRDVRTLLKAGATDSGPTAADAAAAGVSERPPQYVSAPRSPLGQAPSGDAPGPLVTVVRAGIECVKTWLTTGNVPVKIGVLVLLVGVAALLRYASNEGWLNAPIELRLAAVSALAIAALVFAWRKRETHRSFALAVQGGAIGILLLVVFAAFKRYDLIGALPAFGLSVVLVAGVVVLAALQDSRTLAVLGVLAGFFAPLWLSNGGGNHVVLFSYYVVLNVGILAIAWLKPWRELNLLGFVFTWGIGATWGVLEYSPAKFASTEPFLLAFFVFYLALPILYVRNVPTSKDARIRGSLLFGTPLIAFSLQAGLLDGARMALAFWALGLAALYALLAWWLRPREHMQVLWRAYAILAIGFATLAAPLALSARATAATFALEGAGLVWLGFVQRTRFTRWAGLGLQAGAAFALFAGLWTAPGAALTPVANATFMGALLIALAGFASAGLYLRARDRRGATLAYVWGLGWWLGVGIHEIGQFVGTTNRLVAVLLLIGFTGWVAAEVARRVPARARALVMTSLSALWLGLPVACLQWIDQGHPLAALGIWAWPLFMVAGARALVCQRGKDADAGCLAQFGWWVLWPLVLSLEAWHFGAGGGLAQGWVEFLLALPWLALGAVSLLRWRWLEWPLGEIFARMQLVLRGTVFVVLGLWWLQSLHDRGSSAPLTWFAVLNPLGLAEIATLVLGALLVHERVRQGHDERAPWAMLALAAWVQVTLVTLRAVHHWGGEPWNVALMQSTLAQTSVTVVWSVLGVAGWISGSRRGHWWLWLAGAILMGVVLVKLLIVDRGNLGNLLGIGAFIAYGLLCTLVGWLAPAPPRRGTDRPPASGEAVA